MVERKCRQNFACRRNKATYEHRIRKGTSEYWEFYPVPRFALWKLPLAMLETIPSPLFTVYDL
jgi:hypothetical protein